MLVTATRLDVMHRLGRAMVNPTRSRILMTLLEGWRTRLLCMLVGEWEADANES